MPTCVVSGTLVDPSGTAISGAPLSFRLMAPIVVTPSIGPVADSTTSASDGTWSLTIGQSLSGIISITSQDVPTAKPVIYGFNVIIPASATATFSSILVD